MSEALRAGYKLTEVGVIPEDWSTASIESITNQVGDGLHGIPNYSATGKYFFINGNNLIDGKVVVTSETQAVDRSEFVKYRKPLTDRTILLSINGTVGNLGLFDGEPVVLGKSAAYLNVKSEISKQFVYHSLQTEFVKRQFFDGMTGSTIGNLGLGTIRQTQIFLPLTFEEQRAIAAALSDIDALLAKLDTLIAKKRNIKQATMQQLLTGQTRLQGFSGEWEVKRLGDVSEIAMGRTPRRLNSAFWGTGYKWLSIADLKAKIISNSKEEITSLAAAEMAIIPKGTLLMSFKLSIGRLAFAGCDLFTNEAICSFNKLRANADFLYYQLGRVDFALSGKQAVKGYTLNKESLKQVEVSLPSMDEQTAIAAILSDMDTEIATLETRRDKTQALKQGMMQELLTGRIRLI